MAAVCAVVLLGLFAFDALAGSVPAPAAFTVSGLFILPVAVAGWLLSGRFVLGLAVLSVVLLGLLAGLGRVAAFTAGTRSVAVVLLAVFAHMAASGIRTARRLRERELRVLVDTTAQVSGAHSVDQLLTAVVGAAGNLSARVAVWRMVAGDVVEVAAESSGRRMEGATVVRLDPPLQRLLAGRGARVFSLMELPAGMQDALQGAGMREVALAPIAIRGKPWGLLAAAALDQSPFEAGELDVLAGIAELCGLGLAAAG